MAPHVWHNRNTLPQDSLARQAGRVRWAKRGVSPSVHIVPFSHVSRFARHGLWPLADCFSILIERPLLSRPLILQDRAC